LTNTKILNYGRHLIEQEDIDAVVSILKGDLITQGPIVEQFESALAKKVGAKFAVTVTSGTAALHLACLAAEVKSGSVGITSAMTFVASANALAYCGAKVGLCDIDPKTLNMSPESLNNSLKKNPETEVVIPVHFSGLTADSKAIRDIAGKRIIIEDAAHALGAKYSCGNPVGCGAYADMTAFSFHPVKPITTGEGGAIVTNDKNLAHKLKTLRTHGIEREAEFFEYKDAAFDKDQQCPWYYEQQNLGFNYRMTDIQAALGLSQIKKLDSFIARRRSIAKQYNHAFKKLKNIQRPQCSEDYTARSGHHIYILQFDFNKIGLTRTQFVKNLMARNIGSQVHYIPVYHHPYHAKKMGLERSSFPRTENYYKSCLSIPIYPGMTNHDISNVINAIIEVTRN
jgi:perosamine synthetase